SLLIAAVGVPYAEDLLRMMGATPEVVAVGAGYTRWMLGGSFTILLLFLLNAALRGAGNAALAMRVLWVANGINIVLDPCLIYGWGPCPALGATGAAVATNIGRGVGVLLALYYLVGGAGRLKIAYRHLAVALGVMARLLRVSAGGVCQFVIATSSYIVLMRIIATYGSEAVAGYTIAIRIVMFTFLPAWGLSHATETLVGQNLGAGQPQRAADQACAVDKFYELQLSRSLDRF